MWRRVRVRLQQRVTSCLSIQAVALCLGDPKEISESSSVLVEVDCCANDIGVPWSARKVLMQRDMTDLQQLVVGMSELNEREYELQKPE